MDNLLFALPGGVKGTLCDQEKNRAQSGVTYYEVNGQRIPLRQERVQLASRDCLIFKFQICELNE